MTPREIKNIPVSVHQRLLDRARKSGRPFNSLLQYYAMERFLYRLSESPHADSFLLKGALMLQVWRVPVLRHTLDIDLLGRVDNDTANIATIVRGVCAQSVPDDGMIFDPDTVNVSPITADAEYVGVRATFKGSLGKARVPMQIDIGIGDFVVGAAENLPQADCAWFDCLPITTARRTVLDLAEDHADPITLGQAVKQGIERGLFTRRDVGPAIRASGRA